MKLDLRFALGFFLGLVLLASPSGFAAGYCDGHSVAIRATGAGVEGRRYREGVLVSRWMVFTPACSDYWSPVDSGKLVVFQACHHLYAVNCYGQGWIPVSGGDPSGMGSGKLALEAIPNGEVTYLRVGRQFFRLTVLGESREISAAEYYRHAEVAALL